MPWTCRAELAGIVKETEWGDKSRRYYLTRTEEYVDGLKAALGIWCAHRARDVRILARSYQVCINARLLSLQESKPPASAEIRVLTGGKGEHSVL